jgi:hypothetical protein
LNALSLSFPVVLAEIFFVRMMMPGRGRIASQNDLLEPVRDLQLIEVS